MHEWEQITQTMWRMNVPGGWLYLHSEPTGTNKLMTFVPRPPELTNPLVAQYILDIANEAKQ